jgi:predicted nucleotidyltransferase
MTVSRPLPTPRLPDPIQQVLGDFVQATQGAFGDQLRAIVLFGSAAEGKLHTTSDVNLMLVLSAFDQNCADRLRQPLRFAQAAIQLRPMFLLSEEIPAATRVFAPKFADVLRRRVILFGEDPFAGVTVSREAEIRQLKQQLLNITLRLRSAYVARSLREEQLAAFVADMVGPLRSYSAAMYELDGQPAGSPQEAFERLGTELKIADWSRTLADIAAVQGAQMLSPGVAGRVLFQLLEFVHLTIARVEAIPAEVRRESV